MSADVYKKHHSHISSKRAKSEGWSRVPPLSVRAETYSMIEEANKNYMSGEYVSWTTTNSSAGDPVTTYATWTGAWPVTTGDYWYNYNDDYYTVPYTPSPTITIIDKNSEVEELKRKVENLIKQGGDKVEKRTLYRVYMVDPRKNGQILMSGKEVIAENENQAMLKVGVAEVAASVGVDLEEVDVFVEVVATFIRPRKSTQRVKVVKDNDED